MAAASEALDRTTRGHLEWPRHIFWASTTAPWFSNPSCAGNFDPPFRNGHASIHKALHTSTFNKKEQTCLANISILTFFSCRLFGFSRLSLDICFSWELFPLTFLSLENSFPSHLFLLIWSLHTSFFYFYSFPPLTLTVSFLCQCFILVITLGLFHSCPFSPWLFVVPLLYVYLPKTPKLWKAGNRIAKQYRNMMKYGCVLKWGYPCSSSILIRFSIFSILLVVPPFLENLIYNIHTEYIHLHLRQKLAASCDNPNPKFRKVRLPEWSIEIQMVGRNMSKPYLTGGIIRFSKTIWG